MTSSDFKLNLSKKNALWGTQTLTKKDCQKIVEECFEAEGYKLTSSQFRNAVGKYYPDPARTKDGAYRKTFEKYVAEVCKELDRMHNFQDTDKPFIPTQL